MPCGSNASTELVLTILMLSEFHEQFSVILESEMNGGVTQPTPWLTHLRHFIQRHAPGDVARKAQEIGGGEGDFTLREVKAGLSHQRIRAGEVKAQNGNRFQNLGCSSGGGIAVGS